MIPIIERALGIPSRSDREYWASSEEIFDRLGIESSLKTCLTEVRATRNLGAVLGEIKLKRTRNFVAYYSQEVRWGLNQSFEYELEDKNLPAWVSSGIGVTLSNSEPSLYIINGDLQEGISDQYWQELNQSLDPKEALLEGLRHAVILAGQRKPGPDYRYGLGKTSWQGKLVESEHFKIIF